MSGSKDSRALRLERLESRSLLAAGVFDFPLDIGNDPVDRQLPSDPREVSRSQTLRSDPLRSENDLFPANARNGESFLSERTQSRNEERLGNQANRQRDGGSSQRQQTVRASSFESLQLVNATPSQATTGTSPLTVTDSPLTQTSITQAAQVNSTNTVARVATQVTIRNPAAISLVADRTDNDSLANLNIESEVASSSNERPTIDSSTLAQSKVSDRLEIQHAKVQASSLGRDAVSDVQEQVVDSVGGFIDLSPLDLTNPNIDASFNEFDDSEPWTLDLNSTRLLGRLSNQSAIQEFATLQATDDRIDNRARVVDRTIQDWFNGAGGLIALDQVNLPASVLRLDALMINIGLDSTVALHRSIDHDGGRITPAISGPALDAIMASLEQVAASKTQPINDPRAFRIPVAAYPAVAAVATTIAVSARRKHKTPLQAVTKTVAVPQDD